MLRTYLKPLVPLWLRRLRHHKPKFDYREQYDEQARNNTASEVIGDGGYDAIGRMQLDLLIRRGLQPGHTLVDFGCGNGRLARHAVPYLDRGTYIGLDHCQAFLDRARASLGGPPDRWRLQTGFEFPPLAADRLCAFSVFTHMEHEDAYRYLRAARSAVKPGGKLVFSCLPLDQPLARDLFRAEAAETLVQRWSRVRNVCTSRETMTHIAEMAGWHVESWLDGDEPSFAAGAVFGQSAATLVHAGA
jgi:SAM-dependent methyltransferase